MPKGKYSVNSSVLGSRAEQQQGGRIEARRHERWRVKGSEARRGVQGRKRDHGNIFNNRTILSNTLYTLQEPPCSAATSRTGHATSDARTRTPQRQDACSARDYSAGRGCDGNWHGPHPRPAFAPLQPTVLPHVLQLRFFRGLASFPRSPCDRLRAGAGRALAEAPTFVCPTIWTSSCALEFSGSAGIGVGLQTGTAGALHVASCSSLSFASPLLSPSCASEDSCPVLVCPLALASSRSRRGA